MAAALISATLRPVHPSAAGSHYRSMGEVGRKGEKGSSSVRAPSSFRGLLVVFPVSIFFVSLSCFLSFYFRVIISFSLFSFNSLSLSLSSSFISLFGFRYLIKSSYDEKDEATARNAVSFPFFLSFSRVTEAAMLVRDGTTE